MFESESGLIRKKTEYEKYVTDLNFPVSWLNRKKLWYLPYLLHLAIAISISMGFGSWIVGLAYWGGLMSHPIQGWLVNAFGHSKGYRNGNQKTRLDTPTGPIEYDRPKITHAPDFESKYHQAHVRRPEEFEKVITDMVINGVSTRKVKDSLKSVTGKEVALSRSTVSRVTKRLRAEFRDWQRKDLSKLKVMYLF